MDFVRSRALWGTPLIVVGCVSMPEGLGAGLFVPILFGVAGLPLLYALFEDSVERPWAAIAGFPLLGLAASGLWQAIPPDNAAGWGGSPLLGGVGVGFSAVCERWWSLVLGGVLLTMAIVAGLPAGLGEYAIVGASSWGWLPRSACSRSCPPASREREEG